jgi:glycerophosphoryl diester phosphodiesterase
LGPPGSRGGKRLADTPKTLHRAWVDEVRPCGARVVVWNRQITRESVDYAHERGMKVWVYTIDDPALANAMLDLGADGIISNNPSMIQQTLAIRVAKR